MTIDTGALEVGRFFTQPDTEPENEIEWEIRDAQIGSGEKVAFFQPGVEFPKSWSLTASNIVAQKYFRGKLGTPERETSFKQVVGRVVGRICSWGEEHGYFDAFTSIIFGHELAHILFKQLASFNSPVWFNIGAEGRTQQASACFILDVEDTMDSIKDWWVTEADIFRGGSGSGANISRIREDGASLSRGGTASGPLSFMRAADAGAGAIKSGGTTRRAAKMVILDVDHPDIEAFIECKAREERKIRALRAAGFDVDFDGQDTHTLGYQNANNSVRVSDDFLAAVEADGDWNLISRLDGRVVKTVKARALMEKIAAAAHACADPGLQYDTTINSWNTTPHMGRLTGSNPCAEHVRRNNSSCNLSSINLMKFLQDDGSFDLKAYRQTIRIMFIAMDILIAGGEFPTEAIKEVTHQDRDLGLGYCNLGALLMAKGLPYDSDEGRAYAAALASYMTATAYKTSSEMAAVLGPHPTFDAAGAVPVMKKHAAHAQTMHTLFDRCGQDIEALRSAAWVTWGDVMQATKEVGLRNAQATLLAPTGTISFMMDADTTGVEPDLSLKKTKRLVGGGTLSMVNQTVPRALKGLGYQPNQIHDVVAHIDAHSSVVGAPHLAVEHYPVFATSMGDNAIEAMGHVRMMGAIQPGLSGAISKTVNLPSSATIEDVLETYMQAWRMGVKCIALYVEGSKVAEPMTVDRKKVEVVEKVVERPSRHRLPKRRPSQTTSFRLLGAGGGVACEGYLTAGEYPDTRQVGEIFVKVAKQGSTLAGVMDAFAIAVSIGLQYGVPLKVFVEKFVNMHFEPRGGVDDSDFMSVTSIVDYIFRRLAGDYLTLEERQSLNVLTIADRKALMNDMPATTGNGHGKPKPVSPAVDAPLCYSCGQTMQQAGSCYVCPGCGSTSGCS